MKTRGLLLPTFLLATGLAGALYVSSQCGGQRALPAAPPRRHPWTSVRAALSGNQR